MSRLIMALGLLFNAEEEEIEHHIWYLKNVQAQVLGPIILWCFSPWHHLNGARAADPGSVLCFHFTSLTLA